MARGAGTGVRGAGKSRSDIVGGLGGPPPMTPDKQPGPEVNPEAAKEAVRVRKLAEALEPEITGIMTRMAGQYGGELVSLEHRLKTTDRIAQKIEREAKARGESHSDVASKVNDSVRYTMKFGDDDYTRGVQKTLDALKAQGYEMRVKNYWKEGDPYQGINVVLKKNGVVTELQFHSPTSYDVKEKDNHALYVKYQNSKSNEERRKLWSEMSTTSRSRVRRPKDYDKLLSVGDLTMQEIELLNG